MWSVILIFFPSFTGRPFSTTLTSLSMCMYTNIHIYIQKYLMSMIHDMPRSSHKNVKWHLLFTGRPFSTALTSSSMCMNILNIYIEILDAHDIAYCIWNVNCFFFIHRSSLFDSTYIIKYVYESIMIYIQKCLTHMI